ncbi:NADH dehydrogenase [ubiquinone] 1 alpha subcomplex subunit 2 [Anastrepha obliqua]|uniref:NADH dehydrogenase [ubiquinone] 1 alpha subcomplex subunit 2 n=1 Tax=Anastrepha ludens TaxID=28586 RepID=UPI0023AF462F|nr:NADH dehydrogenase [ubiquinone] 1 alpha subcomplex subunit 2 [Anastrepha ludens]XP_054744246.1 NADH dehydrogenase [ubiquinone] 1 alpha subcomplex subunit 2 [Anastrepha obliqua]
MRVSIARLTKISPKLKELRIHLSQTDEASKGAREFVEKFYPNFKKSNPELPILIRECAGIQPRLWARYALGKETSVPLTNQSAPEIQKQLEAVAKA